MIEVSMKKANFERYYFVLIKYFKTIIEPMNLNKYRGGGAINNPDPHILYENLKKIFPNISFKVRVFGYDYEYEEDHFELYINTIDNIEYFLHINYEGSESQFIKILDDIGVNFDLGYYEIDKYGNQISEDINLRE